MAINSRPSPENDSDDVHYITRKNRSMYAGIAKGCKDFGSDLEDRMKRKIPDRHKQGAMRFAMTSSSYDEIGARYDRRHPLNQVDEEDQIDKGDQDDERYDSDAVKSMADIKVFYHLVNGPVNDDADDSAIDILFYFNLVLEDFTLFIEKLVPQQNPNHPDWNKAQRLRYRSVLRKEFGSKKTKYGAKKTTKKIS